MKQSLKKILTDIIWRQGYLSFDAMELICKENGKRSSNGARRLRDSESPSIEAIFKRKVIIGYKPKRKIINLPPAFPKKVETQPTLF